MPIVSTIPMTSRQFIELGEDPAGIRLELVNGEVAVTPNVTPEHSFVNIMLGSFIGRHILQHNLGRLYGDVDTLFGKHDVRRPDIIFFSTARLHLVGKKAMEGPPDLCVEIISPSSETIDKVDKYEQYQAAGVAHYWIIDPIERTARAFKLVNDAYHPAGEGRDQETVHFPPFMDLAIALGRLSHLPVERPLP